jgi:hypothetical protein
MPLTCKSAVVKPREVTEYQRKVRLEREVRVIEGLASGAATVDELLQRIGKHIFKDVFYHYDKDTGYTCHGHVEDAEVVERLYLYTELRRTLISLERRKLVDRFKWDSHGAHLWFKL